MDNLRIKNGSHLFDQHFLEARALFLEYFGLIPSLHTVWELDGEKACRFITEKFPAQITSTHQYKWYDRKPGKYEFGRTIIVMKDNCLLEFMSDRCRILHDGKTDQWIDELTLLILPFREKQRHKALEINLIIQSSGVLDMKPMEIKRTKLDLNLFYPDGFSEVDSRIRKRLNQPKDKGIVLLHGLPGSGKTSYLRFLIGKIKKRVLFLSPSVGGNLMDPEFIELLIDNPNSVLVIEDAENIIMDRKQSRGAAVSNLLNISDGLLADFLNVQIICTFNSSTALVDQALMRKGRLIAQYEFGKLNVEKSNTLSRHFGFDTIITRPMTIAEIANQHEKDEQRQSIRIIGFEKKWVEN